MKTDHVHYSVPLRTKLDRKKFVQFWLLPLACVNARHVQFVFQDQTRFLIVHSFMKALAPETIKYVVTWMNGHQETTTTMCHQDDQFRSVQVWYRKDRCVELGLATDAPADHRYVLHFDHHANKAACKSVFAMVLRYHACSLQIANLFQAHVLLQHVDSVLKHWTFPQAFQPDKNAICLKDAAREPDALKFYVRYLQAAYFFFKRHNSNLSAWTLSTTPDPDVLLREILIAYDALPDCRTVRAVPK